VFSGADSSSTSYVVTEPTVCGVSRTISPVGMPAKRVESMSVSDLAFSALWRLRVLLPLTIQTLAYTTY